jgi:tRNA uridine 5-carboxymethylaminomethyl modification enzyme
MEDRGLDTSPIRSVGDSICGSRDADLLGTRGRHTKNASTDGVSHLSPLRVQLDFIRSIEGLEDAEIIRQATLSNTTTAPFSPTLETKLGRPLLCWPDPGSGYEEALGQRLLAGANA